MREDTLEFRLVSIRITIPRPNCSPCVPLPLPTEESDIRCSQEAKFLLVDAYSLDTDGCIHGICSPNIHSQEKEGDLHYAYWSQVTGEWTVKHMSAEVLLRENEYILHIMALNDPDELKLVTCKRGEDSCWVRNLDQYSLAIGPAVEIPFPFSCGYGRPPSCGDILLLARMAKTGIYNVRTRQLIEVERNLYSDIEHFFVTADRIYALTKEWTGYVVDILDFLNSDSWDYTAPVPLLIQDERLIKYINNADNLMTYDDRTVMFAEIEGHLTMLVFDYGVDEDRILFHFRYNWEQERWSSNLIQQEGVAKGDL